MVGAMGEDRLSEAFEAGGEAVLRRHLVIEFHIEVVALVVLGQSGATVLGWSGEPTEAGVELRRTPLPGGRDRSEFGRPAGEQRDMLAAVGSGVRNWRQVGKC